MTRYLFKVEVDESVHDDLWDATTLTLRKALRENVRDGFRILELGTGHIGVLSIFASKIASVDVVAVDIEGRFIDNARRVAARSGAGRINFLQSNWFDAVDGTFDLVFVNLPYIPTKTGDAIGATTDHRQIWDGGDDGLDHAKTILERAPRFLANPNGRLLLGVNTLYVPAERTRRAVEGSKRFRLDSVVRSRISPSQVYICAPLAERGVRE